MSELSSPAIPPRVGPKTLANPQPTRVGKRGSRGAEPPGGGCGGVPPRNQKRGRGARINNPATSGTQNVGEPKANGGGQRGWRGLRPLPGGLGDVPPNFSNKGRAANSCHPATSGTQDAGEPSANEGGQTGGPGGASPLAGGCGGVPPRNQKRGRGARINNPATSGTQNAGKPSANEGGQTWGARGLRPMAGGCGGCPPTKPKEGARRPH
jgi:hypothetical protein